MAFVQQPSNKNMEACTMTNKVLFEEYCDTTSQIKKDISSFSIPLGINEENIGSMSIVGVETKHK